jgi:predicted HTH transcriptional regulator
MALFIQFLLDEKFDKLYAHRLGFIHTGGKMTPEDLRVLIEAGENLEVEFKGEEHAAFNDRDLIREVVCLSNRGGNKPGYLVIGVEDDGRITGARPRHELDIIDPSRIQALVANRTRPSLSCRVEVVSHQKRAILIIEVPRKTQANFPGRGRRTLQNWPLSSDSFA